MKVHSMMIDHVQDTSSGRCLRHLFVAFTFVALAHGEETVAFITQVDSSNPLDGEMNSTFLTFVLDTGDGLL